MAKQYRLLRLIEYVGDAEFIRKSIEGRGIKGRLMLPSGCTIQEAILGETSELLVALESSIAIVETEKTAHTDARIAAGLSCDEDRF